MNLAVVVIPAYEPGDRLVPLVAALREAGHPVLIVDDGSGETFAARFREAAHAGAEVIAHETNRGKGAALKTAFDYLRQVRPHTDVVTADSDGQHTLADIRHVAQVLAEQRASGLTALVLGCRVFDGATPARSRFGNAVSAAVFRLAAGWRLSDTQTGLRGIPAEMLAWALTVPGERFEYEQSMLLRVRRDGFGSVEVPIETVYLDHNASSHFRPVFDSMRVMLPVLAFAASSFVAFLVDTLALLVLHLVTGSVLVSVIGARVLSAAVNFTVNRRLVFRAERHGSLLGQVLRYAVLAVVVLASNIVWMAALTDAGVPLLVAKVITEVALFALGYRAQRSNVFGTRVQGEYISGTTTSVPRTDVAGARLS